MAVVLGALGSLAPKLLQLLQSEYELHKSVRKKMEFVSRELKSIEAALHKVAAVPWDQLDEQVKVWADEVREASYDMEDILDTFLVRVEGGEPASHSRLKRAMKKMGGLFGKFKARRDIAGAVGDIEKQLQEVADRHARYKIDEIVTNPAPASTVDPRLSAFYTKASQLVGIDEPRDALIEILSIGEDDTSCTEMKIISIVGFGGLGKTTLAKAVYDKVNHQFECSAFVPVGRNPDPRKVLRDILIDLIDDDSEKPFSDQYNRKNTVPDLMALDQRQLVNKLRKFIKGKRYFVVIDDIWDRETWDIIKAAFSDSNSRSKIIATSRNSTVSEVIGKVYRMKKLHESQSRKLLYTRTFGVEENWPDNDKLAEVSQKVLHKCDGVPLAIITIASLLAEKKMEEWSNVYDSVGFGQGDDTQVSNMKKILSFSYYDLPFHLRTCLLYLCVSPEDVDVYKYDLIWRWIAEGLVKTEEGKEPFEVGESYFIELINRGMIEPMEEFGFLSHCRVHDMVLHMIRDLSREANFLVVQDSNKQGSHGHVRRLALHEARAIPAVNDVGMQKVRSFNAISCGTDIAPSVSGFQFLRVLSLENWRPLEGHVQLDTEHLGKLLHLRYLELVGTPIRELHRDIGNLKFLQSLVLARTGIQELPKSLGQLSKLLCLYADHQKTILPDWIGKLTSLVDLGMNFADGFIKELGKLRDLRVLDTKITLQDEGQVQEFLLALSNLQKLEHMTARTSKPFVCKDDAIMQPSFVVLFCNNLRILQLYHLQFSRLPKWINPQALPTLCILALNLSKLVQQDIKILGTFQKLCSLCLNVSNLSSGKITISGHARFQNLRYIHVTGLYQLEFVQGAMPRLEDIRLDIRVCLIKDSNDLISLHIGLGNLTALQTITARIDCSYCLPMEVEEVEAELRHAVSIHPNRPTLQINRVNEVRMLTSSDSKMERQQKRALRLRSQIYYLRPLHNAMLQEVVEMDKMKTNLNLSDDTKNKVQAFLQQFADIVYLVRHQLLHVEDGTSIHDRGLNRVTEDIAAMEQAQETLTVQYPRFAAMLDELRYAFSLQGEMPMPETINLNIRVYDIKVDKLGPLDVGLLGKRISSLKGIKAHLICNFCFPTEVEEVEAELRHAVDIHHPNDPPTLDIIRYGVDKMVVNSDSDAQMLERQKYRAGRLWGRIQRQKELHNAMSREVDEMGKLITSLNLSDDTKNKVQRFRQQFEVTVQIVRHKLLPVVDGTPIHDRDVNRVTKDIAAMELAQEELTVEYPRFAAMLDELRYAFSLQGAMPMPEIINLNIRVYEIKVDKLGPLDVGLLGKKISWLKGIKAHLICHFCFPTEVEEVEAELRHAVDIHYPNDPPTLDIIRYAQDKMVNSDSDSQMLERQNWRRQKELHHAMRRKVIRMCNVTDNFNSNDDAIHKEQRFLEHFSTTDVRVKHELHRVDENIPNSDLERVTEEIAGMKRALEILEVENPRSAAMLDELRTAASLSLSDCDTEEEEDEDTEEDEESSAASLSLSDCDTEEEEVKVTEDDEETSAASLSDTEEKENEVTEDNEERISAGSLADTEEEEDEDAEDVSAASPSTV